MRQSPFCTPIGGPDWTPIDSDKIRWTANDKPRHLNNNAIGRVLAIDAKGVTIETAGKSVVRLNTGDPMLRRLDLAYTINMHMAQGITTDKAIIVMGSEERMLSNQRLFNVGVTRARDAVTVVTDDKAKLAQQLDRNPGDKLSALELTGQLAPASGPPSTPAIARTPAPDITPAQKAVFADPVLAPPPAIPVPAPSPALAAKPTATPADAALAKPTPPDHASPAGPNPAKPKPSLPPLPNREKYKGLEL